MAVAEDGYLITEHGLAVPPGGWREHGSTEEGLVSVLHHSEGVSVRLGVIPEVLDLILEATPTTADHLASVRSGTNHVTALPRPATGPAEAAALGQWLYRLPTSAGPITYLADGSMLLTGGVILFSPAAFFVDRTDFFRLEPSRWCPMLQLGITANVDDVAAMREGMRGRLPRGIYGLHERQAHAVRASCRPIRDPAPRGTADPRDD